MEFEFSVSRIKFSKELSDLDRFVIRFLGILDRLGIKYVVIRGYVPILFGRSRTTEDVDIFIEHIDRGKFSQLFGEIENKENNLWLLNTSDMNLAYRMLKEGDNIRVAEKEMVIPNIEIKFSDNEDVWKDTIEVIVNNFSIVTSRIENQIAFKFYLGSEKDIEDAVYLYELFKDRLDMDLLARKCKELNVSKQFDKYV